MTHLPPKQAVVAIIRQNGRYLFVKRSDYTAHAAGYWCPVSGKVEAGESEQQAVEREVMEEVGLQVVAEKKVGTILSDNLLYELHFWSTRVLSGEARITSDEAVDLRWVSAPELDALEPSFGEDIEIIKALDIAAGPDPR